MPKLIRPLSLLVLAFTFALFAGCQGNGPLSRIFPNIAEQAAAGPLQNIAIGFRGAIMFNLLAIVVVGVLTKLVGLDLSFVAGPLIKGITWLLSKPKTATEQVVDSNAEILAELKKLNEKKP